MMDNAVASPKPGGTLTWALLYYLEVITGAVFDQRIRSISSFIIITNIHGDDNREVWKCACMKQSLRRQTVKKALKHEVSE